MLGVKTLRGTRVFYFNEFGAHAAQARETISVPLIGYEGKDNAQSIKATVKG